MISADCLILLSDIDGLYTAPPAKDPDAQHIPVIEHITPEIEAMAGSAGSALAKGGMTTKIAAAKIAVNAGTAMIIANGGDYNPLKAIMDGAKHSWFEPKSNPITQRKRWINGNLEPPRHPDTGRGGGPRADERQKPASCWRHSSGRQFCQR